MININNHNFEGPFSDTAHLKDVSGVYAILTPSNSNQYSVLDIGESSHVRTRVENHDRQHCWERNASYRQINYATYYTYESQRKTIEQGLRNLFNLPCGKR